MSDTLTDRMGALIAGFGDGSNGAAPTEAQWQHILERDPARPITLINFFRLNVEARYEAGSGLSGSGQEAFDRYASVSIPTMQSVGGKFLLVGPYEGMFAGADEDWDVIAIGAYPGTGALLDLFENADYQACFKHRTAACAVQKVLIADC